MFFLISQASIFEGWRQQKEMLNYVDVEIYRKRVCLVYCSQKQTKTLNCHENFSPRRLSPPSFQGSSKNNITLKRDIGDDQKVFCRVIFKEILRWRGTISILNLFCPKIKALILAVQAKIWLYFLKFKILECKNCNYLYRESMQCCDYQN